VHGSRRLNGDDVTMEITRTGELKELVVERTLYSMRS